MTKLLKEFEIMSEISSNLNTSIRQAPGGWTYMFPEKHKPFPFEEMDQTYWLNFARINWRWSLYVGAIYLVTIFGLQRWMKSRPAMNLKTTLFLWNLSLALFSIAGFIRTLPTLLEVFEKPNGFYRSICKRDYIDTPTAFWTLVFGLSKFVELGDTVFIILRKKPLILLQWFHHVATLNFAWMIGPLVEPITVYATIVNFGVHALMYPYFTLTSIGIKIPRVLANVITACQLGQMIFMFLVNIVTSYYYLTGEDCYRHPDSIKGLAIMYGSFVILFGKLFIDTVIMSGRKKGKEGDKRENVKEE